MRRSIGAVRIYFMCLRLFVLLLFVASGLIAAERPPNLLLMYVDNVGFGDFGCCGNAEVRTPHVDKLSAEGVKCTDFYVVTSSCTPSRGALLTGRHPGRNGLAHQLGSEENWYGIGLPHRERILPQYLKEAGYATGCFGKWNIGFAAGSRPTERGFDDFFGFRSGNIHYFKHTYHGEYDMFLGTEKHPVKGYSGDLFAQATCDFIARNKDRPWFAYVPFNAPHYVSSINMTDGEKPQWQAPDAAFAAYGWSRDDPIEKHRYLAVLTAMDSNIGQILQQLDQLSLRDNTVVMLISDMGAIFRPNCGLGVASNGVYRDAAPTLYEGGVRVPAIFRWPGKIPVGSTSNALLSHLDVLPLCLAAAGIAVPTDRVIDGKNPLPALSGKDGSPHERMFFSYGTASAVREGQLKLLRSASNKPWELYDLATDPSEAKNLATVRAEETAVLAKRIADWQASLATDASTPERYKPATSK
ncbi:MAG: sulfatase-like hydrolase/transferase [Verrucomicrobiales bacterium]|nr:sulfatase-like hydrolase/transferase [Verrucomicrobiales bacterium]